MSVLRYVGGKGKLLSPILERLAPLLEKAAIYHELFCGGCAVAIEVARRYPTKKIRLNDLDERIAALWKTIAMGSDADLSRLLKMMDQEPSVELLQRVRSEEAKDEVQMAYRALIENRLTHGGMLEAGPLGGHGQTGSVRIGDRFNAEKLKTEILQIRQLLQGRTEVTSMNALQYLDRSFGDDEVIFLDPPFYTVGKDLYPVFMSEAEHVQLANLLQSKNNWLLSYDVCHEVQNLYLPWAEGHTISTTYSTYTGESGRGPRSEYLIAPKGQMPEVLNLPPDTAVTDVAAPCTDLQPAARSGLGRDEAETVSDTQCRFAEETYLTTEEASRYMRRSVSWLLREKSIPYVRGKPNLYRKSDLDAWFERNKIEGV